MRDNISMLIKVMYQDGKIGEIENNLLDELMLLFLFFWSTTLLPAKMNLGILRSAPL
jgi:hypothetical protein